MAISRICSIEGCGKRHYCGGYCNAHYRRFRRHGDPTAGRARVGEPAQFVDDLVLANLSEEACLLWPYAQDRGGYGVIVIDGANVGAHRFVCREAHGEPPSGDYEAAHSCGNRLCCNPKHLRWATVRDNHADKKQDGTDQAGESNPRAKLTETDVLAIRLSAASAVALALKYGVTKEMIYAIRKRRNWTHL